MLLAFLLLLAIGAASASAKPTTPDSTIVHPHWHRITGDVYSVVAGGRYLAITNNEGQVSLLNKVTKQRQPLAPTNCPGLSAVGFGGGRFAVSCGAGIDTNQIVVDLYDLSTGTWTQQPVAPTICTDETGCIINSIGTTWIRFFEVTPSGCSSHCTYTGYLQNIATGAVQEDPVDSSMASLYDDLNTPSGIGMPCTTSQLGAYSQIYGPPLTFSDDSFWQPAGRFVLVTGYASYEGPGTPDYLYKCGATTKLRLPRTTYASADAVVYQRIEGSTAPLVGRYLPTLRPFIVPRPVGGLVALSKTTVYTDQRAELWAGSFARP